MYVPLHLLTGWVHSVARVNPATFALEAARGLLAGSPIDIALAFGLLGGSIVLFAAFARRGLRSAERARPESKHGDLPRSAGEGAIAPISLTATAVAGEGGQPLGLGEQRAAVGVREASERRELESAVGQAPRARDAPSIRNARSRRSRETKARSLG